MYISGDLPCLILIPSGDIMNGYETIYRQTFK